MRVGLDLDGVGFPFVTEFKKLLRKNLATRPDFMRDEFDIDPQTLGPKLHGQPRSWSWFKHQWDMTSDQFFGIFRMLVEQGLFAQAAPRDGYRALCSELLEAGHEVFIVTNRAVPGAEERAIADTEGWIDRWDIPHSKLIISDDKTSVPADVFLDDYDKNISDVIVRGRGVDGLRRTVGLLYDRTWNQPEQPKGVKYYLADFPLAYGAYDPRGYGTGSRRMFSHDQVLRYIQHLDASWA